MWTPKRILILLGGLALFMAGYFVYAYFLGGIDGLPVLPEIYVLTPGVAPDWLSPGDAGSEGESERKLKWAFGADSEEAKRPIKLDLRSRRLLLAAREFDIVKEDGRVKLSPFSAALFPEDKGDGLFPEIHVVQSEFAYLTLDQPVTNIAELSARKIVAVELVGNKDLLGREAVTLTTNRRTAQKGDDIEVRITNGPLFYDSLTNKIWTDGYVQLLDLKTQPDPTKITAKGMELKLAEDSNPNLTKTAALKPKGREEAVSGLEMLILKSNVEMHLYLDASSSFLAAPADAGRNKPAVAPGEPAEKSHVTIKTAGPFHYDLTKELAIFDSPAIDAAHEPTVPEQVLVSREHKVADGRKYDQLVCDHLELQFRKKTAADPKAPRDGQSSDKEIDTALATTRSEEVVLTLETENTVAFGAELEYRSPTQTTGPQTILRGTPANPMHAVKDGHSIVARDLHLIGADKYGNGQQAIAKGPGQIDLYDKSNPDNTLPSHAVWYDTLVTVKERDGDKMLDVLTLVGNASFVDEEHNQSLYGQRLRVWLFADNQPDDVQKKREAKLANSSKQKLQKIEAFDKVTARSPKMIVHQANHLAMIFKNEPAVGGQLPDFLSEARPGDPSNVFRGASQSGPSPLGAAQLGTAQTAAGNTLMQTPANNRKPIQLWANDVVAYVTVQGDKKELQDLVAQGAVHVYQEGELSADKKTTAKGVDITGEMLNLVHHPRGDTLFVFGDSRKAAQLQLGELLIIGPKVTINQKDNVAEVEGVGAMNMPSDTSFEGGKPATAKSRLTIHWNKDMTFDGKDAEFRGGVQAFQDSATLKCQDLYVTLDHMVSFKEGQKANQNAKVAKLVCNRNVLVEDDKKDPTGKRQQFDRLAAAELTMDNQEGPINATGPGKVEHLAQGSGDDLQPAPRRPNDPGPKDAQVKKLMRILYDGRMFSNKQDNSRNATFYTNVRVFHFPTEDPNADMNPDHPPKDGFYMTCNMLKVFTRQLDKKTSQMMRAEGNVFFRTEDLFGTASVVKYNESQDQIIFEGTPGNPATLYRKQPGKAEPQKINGSLIMYNRKTGEIQGEGGKVISGWLEPRDGSNDIGRLQSVRAGPYGLAAIDGQLVRLPLRADAQRRLTSPPRGGFGNVQACFPRLFPV